ncbi:hypothetical protein Tco_1313566 [Tanacetum coccineum]
MFNRCSRDFNTMGKSSVKIELFQELFQASDKEHVSKAEAQACRTTLDTTRMILEFGYRPLNLNFVVAFELKKEDGSSFFAAAVIADVGRMDLFSVQTSVV